MLYSFFSKHPLPEEAEKFYLITACHNAALLNVKLVRWDSAIELWGASWARLGTRTWIQGWPVHRRQVSGAQAASGRPRSGTISKLGTMIRNNTKWHAVPSVSMPRYVCEPRFSMRPQMIALDTHTHNR